MLLVAILCAALWVLPHWLRMCLMAEVDRQEGRSAMGGGQMSKAGAEILKIICVHGECSTGRRW